MPKKRSPFRSAVLVLPAIALLAACSTQGPTTTSAPVATASEEKVSAEQVGENLMGALRAGDFETAHGILATGSARDYADDAAALGAAIAQRGLKPKSWSFEPLAYDVNEAGDDMLAGDVTFDDGTTGKVEITLTALGLSANPWRVQDFRLVKG